MLMKSIKRKYVTANELKNSKFIIFGEMHTSEDRDEVEFLIRRAHALKPFKVLFSEECGSEVFLTPNAIKRGLALEKWSISDRSFKLALELGLQVVGCDLWDKSVYAWDKKDENGIYTDCRRSFALREQFMIDQIMGLCNPHNPHVRGCMIVGDSHLRMTKNPVMGDASALGKLVYNRGLILRSDIGEVA